MVMDIDGFVMKVSISMRLLKDHRKVTTLSLSDPFGQRPSFEERPLNEKIFIFQFVTNI